MRLLSTYLAYTGIMMMIFACKNQPIGPFSNEPVLTIVSISPDTMAEYNDSLSLTLFYEDANGDLGTLDPDKKSIWVKDSRLPRADLYHLRPLAPLQAHVHITGHLRMRLPPLFLLGNDQAESVVFSLKIQDRAGNWSEKVKSDTVWVVGK